MNVKPLNILLADDDSDDCYFFKKALEEIQISTQFTTVHDGEQLMEYLSGNSENLPDVLFLDINMPRKTGLECLSEIKHTKKLKDLSVVIFSTNNSQDTISILFKRGANIYICKPGEFSHLKEVINHALAMAAEKYATSIYQSNSQVKYILNA